MTQPDAKTPKVSSSTHHHHHHHHYHHHTTGTTAAAAPPPPPVTTTAAKREYFYVGSYNGQEVLQKGDAITPSSKNNEGSLISGRCSCHITSKLYAITSLYPLIQ
ncbi:hypothetical protein M0804_006218 [Polistes exclamans]|nr:hypothetical protein M0804_006218 [Polistes exclamans]